jgi:hypothetical protein
LTFPEEIAMKNTSEKLGHVISIAGSRIKVQMILPKKKEEAEKLARATQIGGMVKIVTPSSMTFGLISGLAVVAPSSSQSGTAQRVMEVDLLGESLDYDEAKEFSFQRGVSIYPGLGALVSSTSLRDLAHIYARPQTSCVRIGTIRQAETLAAYVSTDELVGNHFAILGNTGTGKSCSVSSILSAILKAHPHGHIVVLDPHDEYSHAFGEAAEVITPDELRLPYWLLNFEETTEALCSPEEQNRTVEAAILKEALIAAKKEAQGLGAWTGPLTVDTPVPFRLEKLSGHIKSAMGKLNRPEKTQPYLRLLARIENLFKDRRYAFMFSGLLAEDIMSEVLARTLRIPVGGKPVTIFPLSGLPSEIVNVVVSLLCRMIFDFALWSEEGSRVPVLLVCEEAHRYVPREKVPGFTSTRRVLTRIAKEGRKYGVSLGLVTQRPTEVSEVVLSQCNTLFAMRLSNDKDQSFIKYALPENMGGLINTLPALRTQEAIVAGEGVSLPMLIKFDNLEESSRPQTDLCRISHGWQQDRWSQDYVDRVIQRWRNQSR